MTRPSIGSEDRIKGALVLQPMTAQEISKALDLTTNHVRKVALRLRIDGSVRATMVKHGKSRSQVRYELTKEAA